MKYTADEVMQYVEEEDVKFIRLAFCDIYGKMKNISVMPSELHRAFHYGVAIDASAIAGFGSVERSDLFLHPEPDTLVVLPWRPEHGKVVRMYCTVTYPDGTVFENDARSILKRAVAEAKKAGLTFSFGAEMEFYLFKLDENGEQTMEPYDQAGYMDIAPDDKGENVRRDICLTLEQMGIQPEGSHHEEGPGQNEIDFRYSDALSAADNAITFVSVVKAIAGRNGLWANFSPRPLENKAGNGMHINISVKGENPGKDYIPSMVAGILRHVADMTIFLNPSENSYTRLGRNKAPKYITWSCENRSQLIRIPAANGQFRRLELRSPDPLTNPYLAFTLLIYACIYGIVNDMVPPESTDINLYEADSAYLRQFKTLPESRAQAAKLAKNSEFISYYLPRSLIDDYCK